MRNTLVFIGLVVLILIGLAGLFYFFLIGLIGWIATVLTREYLYKHGATPFQQLALQIAFALNICCSAAPFLLMPLGLATKTPGHLSGVASVLFIPPLFGLLGFKMARERGINPIFPTLVLAAVAGISMFGYLFLGNLMIPDFEFQQLWVILLSIAGLLVATLLIWFAQLQSLEPSALLKYKHLFLAIITLMVIHYKAYDYMAWKYRKLLPFGTWDAHEWYWSDGLLPDHTYCLKAKVTEGEFKDYIATLGLEQHPPDPPFEHGFHDPPRPVWGGPVGSAEWWDVTTSMENSYYAWPRMDSWTVAKYENGYLYLYSSEW
jgi:hypothetical protein